MLPLGNALERDTGVLFRMWGQIVMGKDERRRWPTDSKARDSRVSRLGAERKG